MALLTAVLQDGGDLLAVGDDSIVLRPGHATDEAAGYRRRRLADLLAREQLGQGKENARSFLMENADVANEIEKKIKEKLGIGAVVTDDGVLPAPVDF